MPYTVTPSIGANLLTTRTAAELAQVGPVVAADAKLGQQVWAEDGKLYVYGQANATITASTAVCTVNATTFLVTASGGAYTSPPVAMATGDRGWFSKASV